MEKKYILLITIGILIVIFGIVYLIFNHLKLITEVEVCNGTFIATANANSDLCYSGCVRYKGQFVPYETLKYLEEECSKTNS